MTRRTLAISWGNHLFVSQEFNGDKKESQRFGSAVAAIAPAWEDVVRKFQGVHNVRAFERTLEKVEEMYGYQHVPVTLQVEIPQTEQTWKMREGELELWAKYGKPSEQTA